MIRAGIRALREHAGALIRRVIEGETIEVTERGRPVARIVPLHGRSVLDQMVAEGRATAAPGDLLDLSHSRRFRASVRSQRFWQTYGLMSAEVAYRDHERRRPGLWSSSQRPSLMH